MSSSKRPCPRCGCERVIRHIADAATTLCRDCVSVLSKAEKARWTAPSPPLVQRAA